MSILVGCARTVSLWLARSASALVFLVFGAIPSATLAAEPAKDVVFSFYDGQLFRIVVNYDRYETEGLTTDDVVEAISAAYGMAAKPAALAKGALGHYGDPQEVVARWQDPRYRFELVRSSYGSSLSLIGVLRKLEAPAQAAILEARRLDDQEARQRDAAGSERRRSSESQVAASEACEQAEVSDITVEADHR